MRLPASQAQPVRLALPVSDDLWRPVAAAGLDRPDAAPVAVVRLASFVRKAEASRFV